MHVIRIMLGQGTKFDEWILDKHKYPIWGKKLAVMELTIDTKERLSGLTNTLPSVFVIASFPDISSKRTTPKAYTSLFVVAKPSLKYLLRTTRIYKWMEAQIIIEVPSNTVLLDLLTRGPDSQKFQQFSSLRLHLH